MLPAPYPLYLLRLGPENRDLNSRQHGADGERLRSGAL
jgi:hypothetical protein